MSAAGSPIAGDVKPRLPMATVTSDATVLMIASVAIEAGDVKNTPRARAPRAQQ
ncbi:hypothetical protein ACF1BQ_013725 [Bradyrhizobium sp. RDT10]